MKEEKKRILRLVEQGKITAEEAITLIERLEDDYAAKEESMISALSTEVLSQDNSGSQKSEQQSHQKQSTFAAKLIDLIDGAVKKVKELDLDLDLPIGQSQDVNHTFQFNGGSLDSLYLQFVYGSVNILPGSGEDIRVECEAKVYRTDSSEEARTFFLENFAVDLEANKLSIVSDKKTLKTNVTLYIPERNYNDVQVRLFNGPIRGEHVTARELKAKTANGMISFQSLSGGSASLETANGQIKLANNQSKKIEAETINGIIDVNGSPEKLDLQSFNGNIVVDLFNQSCSTLLAKTTTGSIDVYLPEHTPINGELKSNFGNLSASVKGAEILTEKNENLQKELKIGTGDAQQALNLFAETKTGSISIKHNKR
ncbi:DUF4097 family beta strand repeat protein [Bacillus lacus]|uniref:DUF4097 family beta strand repeat protein n=1 Tax=Metabacillus lacus TaxID=1983721 RepID=A0A7X2IZ54_9BACI|nr:DUF4097 domain-containing protein [Metabacillus lacus]MRX72355.1 DUF4097 family beta strand repeat protein [Metabacillus lacus]